VFGAGALQNSALKWSSDHRYHHRFVDKESDPYNINRGFFYAHMGWIFYKDPEERSFDNIRDLLKDPLILWQDKYYLPIAILSGFVLPTYIGYLFGYAFGGFLFGGLFRSVFVHHGTFLINSMAHVLGSQPYSTKVTARDSWITALFSNGEGFHNFHHVFANDYRNGIAWYHWDPSKWLIWSLDKVGLSSNLTRTPDWQIYKAKLENTHEHLPKAQSEMAQQCHQQLENLKANIEEKIQQLAKMRREFPSRETKIRQRYFRKRLRAETNALKRTWREYKNLAQLTRQLEH
jgi:stearoyl-CoA desaturase (delta-9 desaturase)